MGDQQYGFFAMLEMTVIQHVGWISNASSTALPLTTCALGTMMQTFKLIEADFRGKRFADLPHDLSPRRMQSLLHRMKWNSKKGEQFGAPHHV